METNTELKPWETTCKYPEPVEDCLGVTGKNSHVYDWCYSCWLAHDHEADARSALGG